MNVIANLDLSSNKVVEHKFYFMDLMKFICSLLVVAIHLSPLQDVNVFADYLLVECIARVAVPFYFVSSGYLLFRKINLLNFDKLKISAYLNRIVKLYIIWMLIYSPIFVWSLIQSGEDIVHSTLVLFRIVFVLGYHHLWYLHASFVAVVLIGFFLQKKVSLKKILFIGSVLYMVGLLAQSWFGLIKPLQEIPYIWRLLKVVELAMRTTKNGIFFGILFIGMGVWFAKVKKILRFKWTVLGLLISSCLFVAEAVFVEYHELARNHDMYIFLVPTVFFGFYVVAHIDMKHSGIYAHLRKIGFIIYLIHIWVDKVLMFYWGMRIHSMVRYIVVLIVSIIFAEVLVCCSKKCKWLRSLY